MNNYCDKCKVEVDAKHQNCPLCGAFIKKDEVTVISRDGVAKEVIEYGFPPVNTEGIIKNVLLKIAIFACLIGVATVLLVDFLASKHLDWSLHVVVGVALFWLTLGRALFFKLNIGKQVVWDCIFSVMLVVYIQYVIGQLDAWWSYNYAMPCIILAFLTTIIAIMIMKYKRWGEYALSATVLCFITLAPLIYSLIRFHSAHFMTYICAGVGVASLLFMMIFGKKSYFRELRKKFHI